MAGTPYNSSQSDARKEDSEFLGNGNANDRISDEDGEKSSKSEDDDVKSSESEDDDESVDLSEEPVIDNTSVAIACDDGCVRTYTISNSDKLIYNKSLPRVSGEIALPGGLGSGTELCIWSLLSLRFKTNPLRAIYITSVKVNCLRL